MSRLRSLSGALGRLLGCSAAAVLSVQASLPGAAQASCAMPEPIVIWSFPGTGQTDVPLDADLLIVTQGVATNAPITLDGELLSAAGTVPGHYDLGVLQARTTHTVAIAATDFSTGRPLELSWTFTTGDALAAEDSPNAVAILSKSGRTIEEGKQLQCSGALFANTCFDTGAPTLESFETDVDAALWAVEILASNSGGGSSWRLYPGECGQPRALDYGGQRAVGVNYRVHAIQRDGSTASSELLAGPLGNEDGAMPARMNDAGHSGQETPDASSSCAAIGVGRGRHGSVALWLVGLASVASRLRTRIRARG